MTDTSATEEAGPEDTGKALVLFMPSGQRGYFPVGTPVIGLYATSNPARTGPYLSRDLTVNRYEEAVRQYIGKDSAELRWGARVRHPDAMQLITIDDVKGKIDEFMAKN